MKPYILHLIFALILIIGACKKENVPEAEPVSATDVLSGRQVKYTILVVSEESATKGLAAARVALSVNGAINQQETDSTGQAVFYNLAPGVAAVTIERDSFMTVNYTVNLYQNQPDSLYDASNIRSASTMVMLLPLYSANNAELRGHIFADLDLTLGGLEEVTEPLNIYAQIEQSQLANLVNHSGDGEMLRVVYENSRFQTTYNPANGYSISLPALFSGLNYEIVADDFEYNQQINATTTQRKIYQMPVQIQRVYSQKISYTDLVFN